jgi:TPR repeat protein
VVKDDSAEGPLRGLAAAALGDSARLGRGMPVNVKKAVTLYDRAIELGHKAAARNLGLYWEGVWGADTPDERLPDNARAIQMYKRGGTDSRCQLRMSNLRAAVQ